MRAMQPPEVKPGDVIGFSGACCRSVLINVATCGIPFWGISHVGIVASARGKNFLFEATEDDYPCALTGRVSPGVKAVVLEDRIQSYPGRVWCYPLYRELDGDESLDLSEFTYTVIGRPYDSIGAIRVAGLITPRVLGLLGCADTSRLFCSELVAAALAAVGIFDTGNVSSWSPNRLVRSLHRSGIIQKHERLRKG